MPDMNACDVLIVGAGPVGLTLAIDLAWRGIDVTLVETRAPAAPPEPKCNHVAARTMEIFRRLGVAERVRDAGLPADYPHDISYRTTFTGQELTRILIPCRRDRFTRRDGPDCNWPTPEPPHRINQIFLEPILFEHAAAQPRVRIISQTAVEDVRIEDNSANAALRDLQTDAVRRLSCRYLVGCDGARSVVRKAIGAELTGDAVVQRVQSTYIRAPDLIHRQLHERAWGTGVINPRRAGMVYAIDGRERWLVHNYMKPGEGDFDSVDRDACIRTILGVPADFKYDIISREDWYGRRLIANRFRDRCAFIAGDAAHIWVPYAGYGMNAGIADAMNLSWLLAAHLNGWAPASILDAYEAERWPITSQVSRFAMSHAEAEIRRRGAVPDEIEDEGAEGERARRRTGRLTYEINVQQYACAGLNFGTYYDRSPIIAYDGTEPPAYTMSSYTPSTVPGCRTPHLWCKDGSSLYDAMGPEFTLLRFDSAVDVAALELAARDRGVPLKLLDVEPAAAAFDGLLVLSRPDQHVAWRGDRSPADPLALIDRVRGAANQTPRPSGIFEAHQSIMPRGLIRWWIPVHAQENALNDSQECRF
jgi:2-polyprenyl-6-methoxyphenol hydroxylase-like FAD-dependent oxidoreductase